MIFPCRFMASKQAKTGRPDPSELFWNVLWFLLKCLVSNLKSNPCKCSTGVILVVVWVSRWSLQRTSVPDEHHEHDVTFLLQRLAGQTEAVPGQRQSRRRVRSSVWDRGTYNHVIRCVSKKVLLFQFLDWLRFLILFIWSDSCCFKGFNVAYALSLDKKLSIHLAKSVQLHVYRTVRRYN